MPTNEKTSPGLPPPGFDLGKGWFVLPDGSMYGRRTVLVTPEEAESAGAIVNRAAERVRAAAPEMLELLREFIEDCPPHGHDNACRRGTYCPHKEAKALLKRIDGDRP